MEIGSSSSTCGGGGGGVGGSKSQGLKFEIDPPSAGKKVRSGVVAQGPRCQVEGCKVDLSDAKAYYSRHKVCSIHSKSPQVIVAGLHQRFCQQCSRFHQLPEFDQGKRSCRRRLAGHNERRRKPPPGSLLSNRYGNLSSSAFENNGRFSMDFATNPILQGRDSWPSTLSSGRQMGNQVTVAGKFELSWQCNQQNPPPDLLQGLMTGTSYVGPGISDSCNAPSLLSNQPWGSRNHSSSRAETNSLVQACVPTGHFSISSQGNQVSSRLREMPPELGLGQISQPENRQYSSELEMAPQGMGQYREIQQPTGFSSSVQHTNWSL